MKFIFNKVGFVDEAEVSLRDLTVVCGANNTGKTYISHTIYGLLNWLRDEADYDFPASVVKEICENGNATYDFDLISIVEKACDKFSRGGLVDLFNADEEFFEESSVRLVLDGEDVESYFNAKAELNIVLGGGDKSSILIEKRSGDFSVYITTLNFTASHEFLRMILSREFSKFVFKTVLDEVFVITSERTGVAMFYKDLDSHANAILDHLSSNSGRVGNPFELIKKMRSRYSLPIRSNIDLLRFSSDAVKKKSFLLEDKVKYKYVFDKLKSLVGGGFVVTASGSYYVPVKERNRAANRLPIHMASSAAKSIFLFELYLRHHASKNQILIFDEPELNLHPDAQRELARLIVRVANSGVKILVTTHSDHFLRELNALIMLAEASESQDKHDLMKESKISKEDLIKHERVLAYVNSAREHRAFQMPTSKFGIKLDLFNREIKLANDLMSQAYSILLEMEMEMEASEEAVGCEVGK